jgi:hypothetical protein
MKGFLDANGESVFDLMDHILSPSGDEGENKDGQNPMEVPALPLFAALFYSPSQ